MPSNCHPFETRAQRWCLTRNFFELEQKIRENFFSSCQNFSFRMFFAKKKKNGEFVSLRGGQIFFSIKNFNGGGGDAFLVLSLFTISSSFSLILKLIRIPFDTTGCIWRQRQSYQLVILWIDYATKLVHLAESNAQNVVLVFWLGIKCSSLVVPWNLVSAKKLRSTISRIY